MAIDIYKLPLKNRVVYSFILEKENGNVRKFANEIGKSQQVISRLFHVDRRSGKYPNVLDDVVDAICKRYDVDKDDFLQGRYGGIIELTALSYNKEEMEKQLPSILKSRIGTEEGKPYYNVPFKMGYDLPYNDNTANPDYIINFTPFNRCDFWCNAAGYSMYPTFASGDIVAFQVIEDFSYLINNEIYGIVLKNGLRTIKRVKERGDVLILIPDNKEYDEQEVLKSDVIAIFRVMGTVKVF